LNKFKFYSFIIHLNCLRTLFLIFLTIFISHYVYKTVQVFDDFNTISLNVEDFDSEEEKSSESEDEMEELDEYLFDHNKNLYLNNIFCNLSQVNDLHLLSPLKEVDSPPPIV
tara:strand:- start:1688 stop:2023 length:336 start_codon:yes stop_codon:yes gene_type:complete